MKKGQNRDQTVRVTFDPSRADSWAFDPESVRMTSAGKIVLTQFPANQRWSFSGGFSVTGKDKTPNPPPDEFQRDAGGSSASQLTISDAFSTRGTYCYTVTVTLPDGRLVTSPDPQIINTNPPGDP